MEVIKLGFHLIIEFCKLETKFVASVVGAFVLAWLIGLVGADAEGFCDACVAALVVALLVGIAAFFLLPKTVKSQLSEVNYHMDWLFHIAGTVAVTVYAFFVLLPIFACFAS